MLLLRKQKTFVGKIADMLANADESQTPLKQSLEQLSKTLTYLIIAIALVTFLVSVFIRGEQPLEGLMVAVALAVAAIPEGLPAIVTILLSLGTTTLAKRNAIVRKLPAVETLGSTEIIASDKTGTLTMNQMTVEKVYFTTKPFLMRKKTLEVTHRYIAEALKDSDSLLYILLKEGKITGVCTVDVSGNSNYLYGACDC